MLLRLLVTWGRAAAAAVVMLAGTDWSVEGDCNDLAPTVDVIKYWGWFFEGVTAADAT